MKRIVFVLLFLCCVCFASGRDTLVVRRDAFPSAIETQFLDKRIRFKPVIRPLVPIPGGRQAYYTYLWDFGDGHFSTLESPEHQYQKPGDYEVSLYVVNNYDNGPRPKKPKTKVSVDSKLAATPESVAGQDQKLLSARTFEDNFFKSNGVFQIFKNADAVPGEDMSLVVGVKANAPKGKILILTNEKLINPNGFVVANQSQYHQEVVNPAVDVRDVQSLWANVQRTTITQSGSPDYGLTEEIEFAGNQATEFFTDLLEGYKTVSEYDIAGELGATQFSIINLDVTPDMLADTNAIVTITGIYLAEGKDPVVHKLDVPVTTSHDPNKMSVRPAFMDYRLQFKKKDLTYKVQFQNDGEGDAKVVRLEMFFPKEVDVHSFKLLNLYPHCDTCANDADLGCYTLKIENQKVVFSFRGIALPGTASPTVTDADSTKGFVRFTMKTHKKLQNKALPSYTDIYFDKNEPIRTNRAVGRFRPGLSPLLFLGLKTPAKAEDDRIGKFTKGYTVGVGLAPIAPYRKPYWQVELYASTYGTESNVQIQRRGEVLVSDGSGQGKYYLYNAVDSLAARDYISLQVPLQLRYNFNRFLSMGAGALAKTDINYDRSQSVTYHVVQADGTTAPYLVDSEVSKEKRSPVRFSPFVDLNVGMAYLGPALGVRYQYDKTFKNYLNVYLMWRL